MSDPRDQSLARAYELIEMDRLDEARLILEPLLQQDQDNPDVWWLYAHAVDNAAEARRALERVQQLSPDYPGVAELQQQIEAEPESASDLPAAATAADDDLDFDDDDFDLDDDEEEPPAARRSRLRPLLLVALLIVLIVLLLFILDPFGGGDDPEPTQIAQIEATPTQEVMAPVEAFTPEVDAEATKTDDIEPDTEIAEETGVLDSEETEEPDVSDEPDDITETPLASDASQTPESVATEESDSSDEAPIDPATEEAADAGSDVDSEAEASDADATSTDFNALVVALQGDVDLFSDTTEIIQTAEFGPTLIVSVCSEAGDQLRESINQVMLTAGTESERLPESVEGVGVRLINCEDGSSINTLAVSVSAAKAFADGTIDQDDYRSQWRAIG